MKRNYFPNYFIANESIFDVWILKIVRRFLRRFVQEVLQSF